MSIRVPAGFRLAGVHCGIKSDPRKEDLALVICDEPATAAGVYTQNLVCAAPVLLDRRRTPSDRIRALVIDSGNANACTGRRGLDDARQMAQLAARACGAEEDQALVLSTGIIGEFLPMDRIARGVADAAGRLGTGQSHLVAAARAMMTTDTVHKLAGRAVTLAGGQVQITGMAKGAAMIGPNMATMLGVILSDARLRAEDAQAALLRAVDRSFNCISVDGHMSTNDSVLLLASGAAAEDALCGQDLETFSAALEEVSIELARAIPHDGEGATHLVTIEVTGCADRQAAHQIAKTVADSPLVKTAVAGADPNWGRIVSAAGYAGVPFDPAEVGLVVNGIPLYRQGAPLAFDAAAAAESIRDNHETSIVLSFREGRASARFWTSDLTAEYVRLNADYHT